jgi:hypothetical protein
VNARGKRVLPVRGVKRSGFHRGAAYLSQKTGGVFAGFVGPLTTPRSEPAEYPTGY